VPTTRNNQASKRLDDQTAKHFVFEGFDAPTYTPVPDAIFDQLLTELSHAELRVLLYIVRRTFGFKKKHDFISYSQFRDGITTYDGRQLDKGCGVKNPTHLSSALKSLVRKGIIESYKSGGHTSVYSLHFKNTTTQAGSTRPGSTNSDSTGERSQLLPDRQVQETVLQETDKGSRENDILWERVKLELAMQMSKPNFETWFRDTKLISLDGEVLVIAAPNPYTAEWLQTRCIPLLRKTIAAIVERPVECHVVVGTK
jgi:hypothetical protein